MIGLRERAEVGARVNLEEKVEKGRALEKQNPVERLRANGQSPKEIAELLGMSVTEVRRLARR
jgi:hypothetical protein